MVCWNMMMNQVEHCLGARMGEGTCRQNATELPPVPTLLHHLIGPSRTCGAANTVLHRASPGGLLAPSGVFCHHAGDKMGAGKAAWGEDILQDLFAGGTGTRVSSPSWDWGRGVKPRPAPAGTIPVLPCCWVQGMETLAPAARKGYPSRNPNSGKSPALPCCTDL